MGYNTNMIGVVDVGGGLRGIYGAGIYDCCLDKNIRFDCCIGVSAGSGNLCAFLSGQRGRNYRSYTEYAFRPAYMGFGQFLKTGSFINLSYIYGTISNSDGEDPLDFPALLRSGVPFITVVTNAVTGKPEYFTQDDLSQDNYTPVMCSSCVPVINKPVRFRNEFYYDGGISDPIPVEKAFSLGCDKVVVILTRPRDYYRKPDRDIFLSRFIQKKLPLAAKALRERSALYNAQLDLCKTYEKEGRVLLLAPESIEGMQTLTKDKGKLRRLYARGMRDAEKLSSFL